MLPDLAVVPAELARDLRQHYRQVVAIQVMHEHRDRQHQRDYPSAARHGGGVYLPMRFRLRLNMAQHAPVNLVY